MPLPAMSKEERHEEEGYMPLLIASKQQKRSKKGHTPSLPHWEDEKNIRYVPYYWGWARRPFPCPRHPPHRAFSVVLLFVLWGAGVEGGGGGKGEGGGGACQTSPLVTKWEITHVTGHGAGNPKPVPRVWVFWGYGIPNPYPYPRETRGKTRSF